MPGATGNDGRPGRPRGPRLALALLFLGLCGLFVGHPAGGFTAGGQAHGDGIYYYVYARSLVFDRDVDFENDYALLGDPHAHGEGPMGYAENRFAAGAGILWIPSFVVAHGVVTTGTAMGWLEDPCDGTSRLHQRITLFGSLLWGFGAVLLSIRLASRYVPVAYATAAGITITLTSPLLWYMVYQPSWPHATNAFVVAAFVYRWHEGRTGRSLRGWALLGALAGLMILVRTQNALFLILPLFDLLRGTVTALTERNGVAVRRELAAAGFMLTCAVVCFTPQMWTWASIYGDPLVIPQGSAFMRWGDSKWVEALFSSRNGLFAWTPMVGLSVLGVLVLGVRHGHARNTAGLLLLAFVLQAYVNGSVDDWWGGWAYGGRRFMGCTVVFVLGCAYGLHGLHRVVLARGRTIATACLGGLIVAVVSYNASFMWDYWHAQLARAQSQPLEPATQRWASRLVSAWYTVLGHPGAMPANLVHAWSAGVSPERYDSTSGWELATDRTRVRGWDRVSFHDPRWAGRGFSEKMELFGVDASLVEHDATFIVPIRYAQPLEFVVLLRPAHPDTRVTVTVGGVTIMNRTLKTGWRWYQGTIPAHALEAGLNYAHVSQRLPKPTSLPARPVGRTGALTPIELEVVSDPEAEVPLRFSLGRTTIDVVERGVTAFAIEPQPSPDGAGYRPLGTFDTFRDVHAAQRLATAIDRLPDGQVVVVGLCNSGLARWDEHGDAALAALGGRATLDHRRWDTRYALIGAKGAAPGTAIEFNTIDGPAVVRIGRAAKLRHEGVAWAKLTLWRPDVEIPHVIAERERLPALDGGPDGTNSP